MTTVEPDVTGGSLHCQHCANTISAGRARAAGWRVWEGQTIGGRHERRVICWACFGPSVAEPAESWDAECRTCGARASHEFEDDDLPLSKQDAEEWRLDHQCDPWSEIWRAS